MKKMTLRMRLTVLSVLLLTLCCAVLTTILNVAANNMVNVIDAEAVTLAHVADEPMVVPSDWVDNGGLPDLAADNEASDTLSPGQGAGEHLPSGMAGEAVPMRTMNARQARTYFFWQSIFYVAIVVIVGGVLTFFLAGQVLKPLRKLGLGMKTRTAHNLSEQLPLPEVSDEVAELTESFNQMSLKLDQSFAMQQRFAQSAAHELRTPLTILKTKIDVFKKRPEHTPQEYETLLETIVSQTDRLVELVRDLLELSASDGVVLDESVDLRAITDQATMELTPLAKEKDVTITVEGGKQYAVGSSALLYRVIFNLMENAIKYNRPGGAVCVMLSEGPMVTISDTGIGIPNEARELIFEPFYRVDKSRSRQMGGAGLGLATVKAIVEQHGGSIQVCANSGGGSCFTVRLL